MAGRVTHYGNIVRDGLVLHLDAAKRDSYPRSGTVWRDLSGNGNDFTIDASGFIYNINGHFSMSNTGGISRSSVPTTATSCTCVFWIQTTDLQALFFEGQTGSYYLGAYRVGNKYYNLNVGNPTLWINTVQEANLYDVFALADNRWRMIEFKSVNFSTWTVLRFNKYSNYTFDSGNVAYISIYDRNLTLAESIQNYNALRGRYGV